MNKQSYEETSALASERLMEILPEDFNRRMRRELAVETVRAEMAQMEAAGKVLQLSDEEIRLLHSFRRFKSTTTKAGSVFKWQTRPIEDGSLVIVAGESVHITDSQDVSDQ